MTPEFRAKIEEIVGSKLYDWQAKLFDAIIQEYEFSCKSFVYAGPGHQSKHECTNQRPHPIEGEHYDSLYEWVGTASFEQLTDLCVVCKGEGMWRGRECYSCHGTGHRQKLHNAPHEGYNCACRIPSELRP